jgi:RNA polymerase primary sigma factor
LLETLTPMEARILRWRFGLNDEDELTLKEIGDKYNLSRERIRQLQEQALEQDSAADQRMMGAGRARK